MVSPCCWCARPIRGPDRLTDIDSRRDGKSSRCRHSIAGHVATAQRCGQQAESQPQVCSMNTFPSQRDCCFVSTSALFGLDTNALPLQRKLKLSARNPCRPCPRHPLKRRYVAPWRLGQPPPATPAAHAQRSAIVGTRSRCETCLPFALAKDCRQASSRLQAATEPDETTTTSVISMRSPGSLQYQPAT